MANPDNLSNALASAKAGDTIELEPGDYDTVKIVNHNFTNFVTLKSADPDNPAEFGSLDIENSSFIRFDGVFVNAGLFNPDAGTWSPLKIEKASHHIGFVNGEISAGGFRAIWATGDTHHITIESNYIHDSGMVLLYCDDLVYRENRINIVEEDAHRFSGINRGLIENNLAIGYKIFPNVGAHKDFMQFEKGGSDLVIRGNVCLPAADIEDPYYQGIFFRTSTNTFDNVLIENNIIMCGNSNGIYVDSGNGVVIRNNTILAPNDEASLAVIITTPDSQNVTVENNIWTAHSVEAAGDVGSNIKLQYVDPNGPFYYNDYYQNATAALGITLEDLRPVADGPADFGSGLGAESRLQELLDGVSPAPDPDPEPDPEPQPDPPVTDPEPEPQPDPPVTDPEPEEPTDPPVTDPEPPAPEPETPVDPVEIIIRRGDHLVKVTV